MPTLNSVNKTRPKLVHFCLRAELFTWLLYKCTDLSGRNLFDVKVASADKCRFFLLLLTHFTKAHFKKCAWMAVIQISVTWFAWSVCCSLLCCGFISFRQTADAGCQLTATALLDSCWRDNVQPTTLPFLPPLSYVGVVMVGVIRLVVGVKSTFGLSHFVITFCLTRNQVDNKNS